MRPPKDSTPFALPDHLAERCERVPGASGKDAAAGELVVCWLHHASRVDENPVLEVAAAAARHYDRPLIVHAGFGGRHPHANDRHTIFMLEGWRSVQRRLAALGITMSITPPPAPGRPSGLRSLAERACCLVAEDHPRNPYPKWIRRMAEETAGPTFVVDASCVLPGRLVPGIHDRAFKFRKACEPGWKLRLEREWPAPRLDAPAAPSTALPSDALDLTGLEDRSLRSLVADWDIDHSVGPVAGMPGGEEEGVRLWRTFRDRHLDRYHRRRNDAAIEGTSRLSPWLHHGMVSPFLIARETSRRGGEGPLKFLDELLVWRELSFHFCRTASDHDTYGAVPAWARETLAAHARDPRRRLTWETLSRGRTGDGLWDLAQASLRERGWLHNNLRMTWGKALLEWSANGRETLDRLLDLNDRYALDGNDPNSIGGLLWCLGLFDRPFAEEHPVTGTLRTRSTSGHARRLDVPQYESLIRGGIRRASVLVIGAGFAGSMAARTLADQGHPVTLIDKGRGPGGRASSRRRGIDPDAPIRHDHGCQVLRLRGHRLQRLADSWIEDGVVAPWSPRVRQADGSVAAPDAPWFVGCPSMNALVAHLQSDLRVRFGRAVASIERCPDGWRAVDEQGDSLGTGEKLILAIPAPQANRLLRPHEGAFHEGSEAAIGDRLAAVGVEATWTLMVDGVDHDPGFDVAIDPNDSIRWLAREASRPERPDRGAWTMHASPEWTDAHLELPKEEAEPLLRALAAGIIGTDLKPGDVHRWRFGLTTDPLGTSHLESDDGSLLVCGDWCLGGRVEHALESGAAAAGAVMRDPSAAVIDEGVGLLFGQVG